MGSKISAVINTLNNEGIIERAIKFVKWADEIVICDMNSEDKTVDIAKKLGAKVYTHKRLEYVEPARNFAISKASNEWILLLDPDEEVSNDLARRLKEMVDKPITSNFVEIPRKNIIFGKWIQNTGWWPDYQIRFFKNGSVIWNNEIHSKPQTRGIGLTLPDDENLAIIHNNYQSISQFLARMNRYTDVESQYLKDKGYEFIWTDLLQKPFNEFLSRFFANKGYMDGLHGLTLSLLQALSFLVVYLKLWELSKFKEQEIELEDIESEQVKAAKQLDYWLKQTQKKNLFKTFMQKVTKG